MRLLLVISVLLLTLSSANAQYWGHQWVVPVGSGINFMTPNAIVFDTDTLGQAGGYPVTNNSCIANESGELALYVIASRIYDRLHDTMPHGTGLISGNTYNSSLVLPLPSHEDSILLVFHVWIGSAIHTTGIYYSVVNMNLRGGLGDVDTLQKNTLVFANDTTAPQLTAIRHANGHDWWVLGKKGGHYDYVTLLVTPNGVQVVEQQSAGLEIESGLVAGEIAVNPQGTQIALAMYEPLGPTNPDEESVLEVIDFDRCTGKLTHTQFLYPTLCYSVSYSPNGKLLYYNTYDTLYQVKGLDATSSISQVAVALNPYYDDSNQTTLSNSFSWGMHELGPDGKIYLSMVPYFSPYTIYAPQNMSLCTIDSPDVEGIGCNFQLNSFYLGGKRSTFGLPNMPNYNLGALVGSGCDTLFNALVEVEKQQIKLYPNPVTDVLHYQTTEQVTDHFVYDVCGKRISLPPLVRQGGSRLNEIDVRRLTAGVYVLEIVTTSNRLRQRFVKIFP